MMRNEIKTKECIAVMGSVTRAMRAQNVLVAAAIRVNVIKAESSQTGKGCAYALSYPCAQQGNVKRVLENAGIRVRSFSENEP